MGGVQVPAHHDLHPLGLPPEGRAAVGGQVSREVLVEDGQVGRVLPLEPRLHHPHPVLCDGGQHMS